MLGVAGIYLWTEKNELGFNLITVFPIGHGPHISAIYLIGNSDLISATWNVIPFRMEYKTIWNNYT